MESAWFVKGSVLSIWLIGEKRILTAYMDWSVRRNTFFPMPVLRRLWNIITFVGALCVKRSIFAELK